jgi:hypothetical protein
MVCVAVDAGTLDDVMAARIGHILTELFHGQHPQPCSDVPLKSAEYLSSFLKKGDVETFLPPEIDSISSAEYNHDSAERERSIRENWFYESKFHSRRVFQDYTSIGSHILLHNDERRKQIAARIAAFAQRPQEEIVPALHHALNSRFNLAKHDRQEFLRDVYSNRTALEFVGKNYAIETGAKFLRQAFPRSEEFFEKLETAYGTERLISFVRDRYQTPTRAGKVFLAAYARHEGGAERAFEYTQRAFQDRIPTTPTKDVQDAPEKSEPTYHPVPMQRQ